MKKLKKMTIFKKKGELGLLLGIAMALFLPSSFANASEFNFSVEPVTPNNQIDRSKSYFDLNLAPKQEEVLSVNLRNDTNKKITVDVDVDSATTNSNVVVEYGKNDIKKDKSVPFDIKKYIEYPSSIDLEAGTQKQVQLKVRMPDQAFDGVSANGITFKERVEETKEEATKSKGMSIKNEYSYVLALLLRQNLNEVQPNILLHNVQPGQINARNVILSDIQNDQATYINQVAIEAQVTKKGSTNVLYSEDQTGLQIAPNTQFSFPVALNGQPLKAGTYRMAMMVYANKDDQGAYKKTIDGQEVRFRNQWKLEKDFTIDGEIAKKLNSKDVTIKKDNMWLYILLGLLALAIALLIIFWILWKRKKEKEEIEEKQAN